MERSSWRGALGRGARLHTRWLAVKLLLVVIFAIVGIIVVVGIVIVAAICTVQAAVAACSVATLIAIVLV